MLRLVSIPRVVGTRIKPIQVEARMFTPAQRKRMWEEARAQVRKNKEAMAS